jgi:hypothetical protein
MKKNNFYLIFSFLLLTPIKAADVSYPQSPWTACEGGTPHSPWAISSLLHDCAEDLNGFKEGRKVHYNKSVGGEEDKPILQDLLTRAFIENVSLDETGEYLLDKFVAFRFPTLGKTFKEAVQSFIENLRPTDTENINIDPSEPTFPKFSTYPQEKVRDFACLIDMLNRDFYPNLQRFRGWAQGKAYEGNELSIEEVANVIYSLRLELPGSTRNELPHKFRRFQHFTAVLVYKFLMLIPEVEYLNWLSETQQDLTEEKGIRRDYLNRLFAQYRDALNQ